MQTVTIKAYHPQTREPMDFQVEAQVCGDFAAHRPGPYATATQDIWFVTHLPTGSEVAYAETLAMARRCAEALPPLPAYTIEPRPGRLPKMHFDKLGWAMQAAQVCAGLEVWFYTPYWYVSPDELVETVKVVLENAKKAEVQP
jgi:hypothetical protein